MKDREKWTRERKGKEIPDTTMTWTYVQRQKATWSQPRHTKYCALGGGSNHGGMNHGARKVFCSQLLNFLYITL